MSRWPRLPCGDSAKSIDLEHAELGCTRIDLDPEGGAEELAALSEELSLPCAGARSCFPKRNTVRRPARAARAQTLERRGPGCSGTRIRSAWISSRPGNLENLMLRGTSRPEPQPGEVEIRVNCRGPELSRCHECRGRISRRTDPLRRRMLGNDFRRRARMSQI